MSAATIPKADVKDSLKNQSRIGVVEVKDARDTGLNTTVYLNGKLIYDTEVFPGIYGDLASARYEIDIKEIKEYNPLFSRTVYFASENINGGNKQRTDCTRGSLYNARNSIRIDHRQFYYEIDNKIWLHRYGIISYDSAWEPVETAQRTMAEKKLVADFSSPTTDIKATSSPVSGWHHSPTHPLKVESVTRTVAILRVEPEGTPLARYLNNFIATLSGNYIAPRAYYADPLGDGKSAFTIISKPLYGHVILHTVPDNRFYLKYERADNGAIVGEMVRTRLIPLLEEAQPGETPGHITDGTPVYYSYYDPGASGQQITREEYAAYLTEKKEIIAQKSGLPKVLSDLLGF